MTRRLQPLPRPVGPWPAHPAHLDPYVAVLGQEGTVALLLHYGGLRIHLSANPNQRRPIVQLVGRDRFAALCARLGGGDLELPMGRPWLVHVLRHVYGLTVEQIVLRVRISDAGVRRLLRAAPTARRLGGPDSSDNDGPQQLTLF